MVRFEDAALLDPDNVPIPLVDEKNWTVCRKVHSLPQVERLGEIEDISVTRGEINQTTYRTYITQDETKARLVKGVEVGRYHVRDRLSQGHREWFDEERFLVSNRVRPVTNRRRIATQRITGVDERLRIVAAVIEPPAYFADSTNSIALHEGSLYRLEYLLALLNSTLFQWRFKITSSNNNVGTNELDSMPFRTIEFSDPTDTGRHNRIVELVNQRVALHEQLLAARIGQEATPVQRRIDATDRRIDRLVYELYELTEEEIEVVEAR